MRPADYLCDTCNEIFEYWKEDLDSFPKHVKCPKCGKEENTRRLFSVPMTDVAQGLMGNASTGYSKNIANHSSKFGSYKGKRVDVKS